MDKAGVERPIGGWVGPSVLVILLGSGVLAPRGIRERFEQAGLDPASDTVKEVLQKFSSQGLVEQPQSGYYKLVSGMSIDLDEMSPETITLSELCVGCTTAPGDRQAFEKLFLPYLDLRKADPRRTARASEPLGEDAPRRSQFFEPTAGVIVRRPTVLPRDSVTRFNFRAMATTYVECAQASALQRFLDDEASALWWLMTGPGGIGKSRLALELCRTADELGWDAGFVDSRPNQTVSWQNWVPSSDTLLIVDSVLSTPREQGELDWVLELEDLMSDRPGGRVRVLFIDRPQSGEFWNERFQRAETARHQYFGAWHPPGAIVEGALVKEPVFTTLEIPGIDVTGVARIMRESAEARRDIWGTKATNLDLVDWGAQADDYLRRLDRLGRPLFAMMAGEIICEKGTLAVMSLEGLAERILQSLLLEWRKAGIDEAHLNLLFFATVRNSVDIGDVALCDPEIAPYLPADPDINQCKILSSVSGMAIKENGAIVIERLLPDPLGELFALLWLRGNRLDNMPRARNADPARALFAFAGRHNSEDVFEFSYRLISDYGLDIKALCAATALQIPEGTKVDETQAEAFKDLVHLHARYNSWPSNKLSSLTSLKSLDLGFSDSLESLPALSCLTSLRSLVLSCCFELRSLPDLSDLTSLETLKLSMCENLEFIPALPRESSLKTIDLSACDSLKSVPDFSQMPSLQALDLSQCRRLEQVPELAGLVNLRNLGLSVRSPSFRLDDLPSPELLQHLHLTGGKELRQLPDLSPLKNLETLMLTGCEGIDSLPDLAPLTSLRTLFLSFCTNIEALPDLSSNQALEVLDVRHCTNLKVVPDFSKLSTLEILDLSGCSRLEQVPELAGLVNLRKLGLWGRSHSVRLQDLPNPELLQDLELFGFTGIRELPALSRFKSLQYLKLQYCENLEALPDLSSLQALRTISLAGCQALRTIPDFSSLQGLRELDLSTCYRRSTELLHADLGDIFKIQRMRSRRLPDFSRLPLLEKLVLSGWFGLRSLPDMSAMRKLKQLNLDACTSLRSLPDLSSLESLEMLDLRDCVNLRSLPDLSALPSLKQVNLQGCKSLRSTLTLSGVDVKY